jgi:hypothetical protein
MFKKILQKVNRLPCFVVENSLDTVLHTVEFDSIEDQVFRVSARRSRNRTVYERLKQ